MCIRDSPYRDEFYDIGVLYRLFAKIFLIYIRYPYRDEFYDMGVLYLLLAKIFLTYTQ